MYKSQKFNGFRKICIILFLFFDFENVQIYIENEP